MSGKRPPLLAAGIQPDINDNRYRNHDCKPSGVTRSCGIWWSISMQTCATKCFVYILLHFHVILFVIIHAPSKGSNSKKKKNVRIFIACCLIYQRISGRARMAWSAVETNQWSRSDSRTSRDAFVWISANWNRFLCSWQKRRPRSF